MEFEAIILEHMGKDIYIGIEAPKEHRRQETVVQNYQVLSPEGQEYKGGGTGLICSEDHKEDAVRLELKAGIEHKECLFDMIDIEARYKKYFYHIYIMNCINVNSSRLFVQKQK
ncbi:MAG: hypothetical protein HFI69_02635 [Lachnospiraceae bacterium]|nr:hypothetical protein [Lachnospiraceae bacterium]